MRVIAQHLWDLWDQGGPYIGDDAPSTRLTVDPSWLLTLTNTAGNFKHPPARWWKRRDNAQVEIEVPNLKNVHIDRSITQDAGRCTITIENQWHESEGQTLPTQVDELGQPGYFSFARGSTALAQSRWGQTENAWFNTLIPNAMLRTYQGYGGQSKTITQARTDGNIILTGIWLIDEVVISATADITLHCRDMGKLLIDQFIFPPLVPQSFYPVAFCRWRYKNGSNPRVLYGHNAEDPYQRAAFSYAKSTGDLGGANIAQAGHYPTDALDETSRSYWLSPGSSASNKWHYYEITLNEPIDQFGIQPVWGNYICFVSVMEGGVWQGQSYINDFQSTANSDYADTNIPFVMVTGIAFELPDYMGLDRVYQAQRVRFTFTELMSTTVANSPTYRVAMRELNVGKGVSNLPTKSIVGITTTSASQGYLLIGNDGGVFAFGPTAHFNGSSGGGGTTNPWVDIEAKADNTGYYTVRADGKVFAFGPGAAHHGDASLAVLGGPITAMALTESENGYWLLGADGGVFAYGDAVYHGNSTALVTSLANVAVDIERREGTTGYWILQANGAVASWGAVFYGSTTPTAGHQAVAMASTHSGNGYWIADDTGAVFSYGDATYAGGPNGHVPPPVDPITDITRLRDDDHYILCASDGGVFGPYPGLVGGFWGSLPGDYSWEVKLPGNYVDYADIIKFLLLWSGWWLYDAGASATKPPVGWYNIENTGIFNATNDGCIAEEVFDKRAVIDAITQLKEVVGFNFWIDDQGAARFEMPNWIVPGNWVDTEDVDGNLVPLHLDPATNVHAIPVIDERTNLFSYDLTFTDAPIRSEIIIATADPEVFLSGTVTSRLTTQDLDPESALLLRGMVKPMMWVNGTFQNKAELDVMAERVATQILFNQRTSQIVCSYNPAIQMNDQVQVYERQTGEVYTHYVKGIATEHDLVSGKMTMTLTTHWLGTGDDWSVVVGGSVPAIGGPPPTITNISPNTGTSNGGDTITITGTHFTGTAVVFGFFDATSFTVDSATQITAVSPAHAAGIVGVRVVTSAGTSNTANYTYTQAAPSAPTVNVVSLNYGSTVGGDSIVLTGTHFLGATAVHFGATAAASFAANSDTSITASNPAHAVGTVDVTVTTPNGTSATTASDLFTYYTPGAAPYIDAVSPNAGNTGGGSSITITGANFTSATSVHFGATVAAFTVDSDTQITVASNPAHAAGVVDVSVTTPNGTSSNTTADQFFYYVAGLYMTADYGQKGALVLQSANNGLWHHGAVTYDGTNLKIYKDGALQTTLATPPIAMETFVTSNLGGNFVGDLNRFAFYQTALSQTRITAHNAQIPGSASNYDAAVLADSPTCYYKLSEASGTAAVDASPHGENGTYGSDPLAFQVADVFGGTSAVRFGDENSGTSSGVDATPAAFNPGSGNWTIECLYRLNSAVTTTPIGPLTQVRPYSGDDGISGFIDLGVDLYLP